MAGWGCFEELLGTSALLTFGVRARIVQYPESTVAVWIIVEHRGVGARNRYHFFFGRLFPPVL